MQKSIPKINILKIFILLSERKKKVNIYLRPLGNKKACKFIKYLKILKNYKKNKYIRPSGNKKVHKAYKTNKMSDSDNEEYYDPPFYQTLHTSPLEIEGIPVNYSIALSNPRDLIRFAKPYTWNRPINSDHVNEITKDLKKMQTPFLLGTFKIIHNPKTGELMIYDGQHRFQGIKNVLTEDPEHNCKTPITLEIYSIHCEDGIEKCPVAKKLFELANKTYNFDKQVDRINSYIEEITNAFVSDPLFKSNIADSDYRPKISKSHVYQNLLQRFKPTVKPSVVEVIGLFKRKNNEISLKQITEILKSNKSNHQYDKARKSNFFLNLTSYPFDKIVQEIVDELNKNNNA